MFPFASHAELGYDLEYATEELRVRNSHLINSVRRSDAYAYVQAAGDLAKKYGHRLTAHPGQVRVSPYEDLTPDSDCYHSSRSLGPLGMR